MIFKPTENLTEAQVKKGLKLVVKDGLAAEAMATLSGGAFLVAIALKFGASNFQIGLMAAMPTFVNIFQLLAIYLVQKIASRKTVAVYSLLMSRLPLFLVGFLPFFFSASVALNLLIGLLAFHYFFGALSGCTWTSWMKDLVPEEMLGSYFSHRSRLIQILNVSLSLVIALIIDYVKAHYPQHEILTYALMFLVAGLIGFSGVAMLAKAPEPKMEPVSTNVLKLIKNAFKNKNFKNLLIFQASWAFAVNLAVPFFSVYLLKMLHMKLFMIIALNIFSQLVNIMFIRIWGKYSDKYSNKSILRICAPFYIFCFILWTFTTMPDVHTLTLPLLFFIFFLNGIASAGVNLALTNIGIKLAPKEGDAIVYLSSRSMVVAFFAGIAPVVGGLFADFFLTRELAWNIEWKSPEGSYLIQTLNLQQWDFFFVLAFLFGIFALYRLTFVKERGEVRRSIIMGEIVNEVKNYATFAGIKTAASLPLSFFSAVKYKRQVKRRARKIKEISIEMLNSIEKPTESKRTALN